MTGNLMLGYKFNNLGVGIEQCNTTKHLKIDQGMLEIYHIMEVFLLIFIVYSINCAGESD
jgi:hypothetical protein